MVEPRIIDKPQPGFFKTRLIRGGPWVGAVIYLPCPMAPHDHDIHPDEWCRPLDRSRKLECLVNGKPGDVYRVWTSQPISMAEYLYLSESAAWDRKHDQTAPAANPRKAVNLGEMAPIF